MSSLQNASKRGIGVIKADNQFGQYNYKEQLRGYLSRNPRPGRSSSRYAGQTSNQSLKNQLDASKKVIPVESEGFFGLKRYSYSKIGPKKYLADSQLYGEKKLQNKTFFCTPKPTPSQNGGSPRVSQFFAQNTSEGQITSEKKKKFEIKPRESDKKTEQKAVQAVKDLFRVPGSPRSIAIKSRMAQDSSSQRQALERNLSGSPEPAFPKVEHSPSPKKPSIVSSPRKGKETLESCLGLSSLQATKPTKPAPVLKIPSAKPLSLDASKGKTEEESTRPSPKITYTIKWDGLFWPKVEDELRFEKVIGQGSFAKVYRGIDLKAQTFVAIKVLDKRKLSDNGFQSMAEKELQIIQSINHPAICKFERMIEDKNRVLSDYCRFILYWNSAAP